MFRGVLGGIIDRAQLQALVQAQISAPSLLSLSLPLSFLFLACQLALFPVNATHLQRAKTVLDNFQIIMMLESINSQKIQLSSVAYWYVRNAPPPFEL